MTLLKKLCVVVLVQNVTLMNVYRVPVQMLSKIFGNQFLQITLLIG